MGVYETETYHQNSKTIHYYIHGTLAGISSDYFLRVSACKHTVLIIKMSLTAF